jgi:hypothetical protein
MTPIGIMDDKLFPCKNFGDNCDHYCHHCRDCARGPGRPRHDLPEEEEGDYECGFCSGLEREAPENSEEEGDEGDKGDDESSAPKKGDSDDDVDDDAPAAGGAAALKAGQRTSKAKLPETKGTERHQAGSRAREGGKGTKDTEHTSSTKPHKQLVVTTTKTVMEVTTVVERKSSNALAKTQQMPQKPPRTIKLKNGARNASVAKPKVVVLKEKAIGISSSESSSSDASTDEEPEKPLPGMPDADDFRPTGLDDDRCDFDFDDDDAPSIGTTPERCMFNPSISPERAHPSLGDAPSALKRKRNNRKVGGTSKRFNTGVRIRKPIIVKKCDKTKEAKDDKKGRGANKPIADARDRAIMSEHKPTTTKKPASANSQDKNTSLMPAKDPAAANKIAKAKTAGEKQEEKDAKGKRELDVYDKERDRELKKKAGRIARSDEEILGAQLGFGGGGNDSQDGRREQNGGEKTKGKKPIAEDEDFSDEEYIPEAHDPLARYSYDYRQKHVWATLMQV